MVLFPEMRAQFLSLQRVFASGLGATHPPSTLPHAHGLLSPRFQRHVHTYRILPDDEGLLSVQVGAAMGALPALANATGRRAGVCVGPSVASWGAGRMQVQKDRGAGSPPGQQPETWHLLALPGTPALRASGAVCFFCISCLQRLALQDARASQPPLQHRAAWQGCFPRRPHGCHRPALGGTEKHLSYSCRCPLPQLGHAGPILAMSVPVMSVLAAGLASLPLFSITSWFLLVPSSLQPPFLAL